jgi:hypothetical protein
VRTALPELISLAYFFAVGWIALWSVRRDLGAVDYHLAALPFGLLSATLAGCVSTLTGRPLDVWSGVAGALVLVAATWGIGRLTRGTAERARAVVGLRSYAIAAGAVGGFGLLAGLARFTVVNNDSFMAYWPLGVDLSRKGAFGLQLMATRSPLIPTINAIWADFGSDWAYVIYPALAAVLVLWIAHTLWVGPLSGASRSVKRLVAIGAAAFLVLEPSFIFHAFFVHSHMVSALYLLMSLTCIWFANRPVSSGPQDVGSRQMPRPAYLILAGGFAAGFALARPDGLAYMFIPVAAAIAALTVSKVEWRSVAAFFGPMLLIVVGTYGAGFVTLGIWSSTKLSGRTAVMILGLLALSAVGPWIVQILDRRLPFRVSGEHFLGLLVAVAAVLMLGVFALKWGTARVALATVAMNLFGGTGGYGYLWYAIAALLVISLLTRDALRTGSWTRSAFLAVALFLVIAGVVHGTSHPGRLGPGDSENRVMFQMVPLMVWYAGSVVARILGTPAKTVAASEAPDDAETKAAPGADPA